MPSETTNNHAAFIWSVADLLRGDYKQSEYGRVILPFTVLRRLDCVMEPVKGDMLAKYDSLKGKVDNYGPVLDRLTDTRHLWNTSKYDLPKLLDDSEQIAANLRAYIAGFSPQIRDILDHFDIDTQITRLDKANLLYMVVGKFAEIDLHPDTVSNLEMGYLYEELIRKFSELSNETAGEHFTPREVIKLMVNLLFIDDPLLSKPGIVKTMFDPACGTGGTLLLGVAEDAAGKGVPFGMEGDYAQFHKEGKADDDRFLLAFNDRLKAALGPAAVSNVTTEIYTIAGKDVCRVHVRPSGFPVDAKVVVIDKKGQHVKQTNFYARINNATHKFVNEEEKQKFIAQRWPS